MSLIRNSLQISVAFITVAGLFAQDVIQPGQPMRGLTPEPATAAGNSYIVTFVTGTPKNARALAAASAGAVVRFNYDWTNAIAVTVPNENAVNALRRNPLVQRVQPDYVVKGRPKPPGNGGGGGGGSTPFVLHTQQQVSYEVQRVGIPSAGNDGTGIGVAVLDTGIDFNHPDLKPAGNTNATAFNAVNPGGSCQDDGGHGTHVAGLLAAQNNSIGILGVASGATLYCVKVLAGNFTGTDAQVMAGLDWVLQNHDKVTPRIRIVNMSLGRTLDSGETLENSVYRPLIDALYARGVVVVAAAGNNPNYEISQMVPAGFPSVISVASTTAANGIRTCLLFGMDTLKSVPADTASGFTTDGAGVTVSAPGEERTDIVSLGSAGCVGLEYGTLSTTLGTTGATRKLVPGLSEARGTSFAAPLVAGVIARVMQKGLVSATFNATEVEGIRSWIRTNASRRGSAPLDHPWGGIIYVASPDGVREGIAQAPQ